MHLYSFVHPIMHYRVIWKLKGLNFILKMF